jgi:hypothetical protein
MILDIKYVEGLFILVAQTPGKAIENQAHHQKTLPTKNHQE